MSESTFETSKTTRHEGGQHTCDADAVVGKVEEGFSEVPMIDIGALLMKGGDNNDVEGGGDGGGRDVDEVSEEEREVARQIHHACRNVGFFYVTNHGIPSDLQDDLITLSRDFFSLSEEEKMNIRMAKAGRAWRGYFPVGGELTSGRPDRKEGIYFGTELSEDHEEVVKGTPIHGANIWPATPGPPFRRAVSAYMDAATRLGHRLMRAVAIGLGLSPAYFRDRFTEDPTILFRVFNYPKHVWEDEADEWGVREHTDYGFLTILRQDDSGGLQVKNRCGHWISAPPKPNAFVINIGDMLEVWTHGLYKATPHRVRNQGQDPRGRISFPLFFDPNWYSSLEPIDKRLLTDLSSSSPSSSSSSSSPPPSSSSSSPSVPHASSSSPAVPSRWDGLDMTSITSSTYGEFLYAKISKVFPELAA